MRRRCRRQDGRVIHRAPVREADEEARKTYIRRFPFAALAELTLWVVEISYMKFTDNTLGFGKKLIWNSKEQE